jgi:hypothetical protein
MALKYSTGLANAIAGGRATVKHALTATTISFGDGTGTGGRDQILDSGDGLGGFAIGDMISVLGSTSNNVETEVLSVVAGAIEVAAGVLADEAAGDQVILATVEGGASIRDIFKNGVMKIFPSPRPASADDTEGVSPLVTISLASGTYNSTTGENGLSLGDPTGGASAKASGEIWSGVASATGTGVWFRVYPRGAAVEGASTTVLRYDGSVGVSGSGADAIMSSTSIVAGTTQTVDIFTFTQPKG